MVVMPAAVELDQLGAGLDAEFGVKVGQRLVHQEHLWLPHDRAAQGDAAASGRPTTASACGPSALEAQQVGCFSDPPLDLRLRDFAQLEAEGMLS